MVGNSKEEEGKKLVSVVISFLNEEKFLTEAVESVIKQEYAHWELFLVDDGSSDKSTEIAKRYVAQNPDKIKYLEHEDHQNKGLSASRNLGIKQAKGTLVALLDADDVWLPKKLANQVAIFEANPGIGMVAEASEYWYNWDDRNSQNEIIPVGVEPGKVYKKRQLMHHLYPLASGAAPCPSGLMIAKAAFERSGYFEESFRKEFGLYEDQAFLTKMYLNEDVYISSDCNNLYRQRPESIVSQVHATGKYHTVRKYYLDWLEAYIKDNKITDKKLWSLVRKANMRYRNPLYYHYTRDFPKRIFYHIRGLVRTAVNFS